MLALYISLLYVERRVPFWLFSGGIGMEVGLCLISIVYVGYAVTRRDFVVPATPEYRKRVRQLLLVLVPLNGLYFGLKYLQLP